MNVTERRQYPRFKPSGIKTIITMGSSSNPVIIKGEVIDISYDGIKIKLDDDAQNNLDGSMRIELFLPNSVIPLNLSGELKHVNQAGELGIHYVDCPVVEALDSFMFECHKLAKT